MYEHYQHPKVTPSLNPLVSCVNLPYNLMHDEVVTGRRQYTTTIFTKAHCEEQFEVAIVTLPIFTHLDYAVRFCVRTVSCQLRFRPGEIIASVGNKCLNSTRTVTRHESSSMSVSAMSVSAILIPIVYLLTIS
jgi:hypothetical protein